jgi:hypothetical protein
MHLHTHEFLADYPSMNDQSHVSGFPNLARTETNDHPDMKTTFGAKQKEPHLLGPKVACGSET